MATNHNDVDAVTGTSTTGHEWDGIKELNTPLPRWWVICFYLTIVWAIGYWIVYPAWPTLAGYTGGVLGYSSRAAVAEQIDELKKMRAGNVALIEKASFAEIKANPTLLAFARAQGRAAFGDNCAPCHGLGATGSKGFPNLNDDDWLWGGKIEDIHQTLKFGIRHDSNETRQGNMTAFGRDGILKKDEIANVAAYARSLAGLKSTTGDLGKGKQLFADNCAVCHADDGKGNPELGAPNLTDAIWLFGSDEASVIETITNGRQGVMPGWTGRLDPVTIKSLAVYVHTLGGGK
jgi:cytochrome c oxidase cbb3-type subunit 3